MDKPKITCSEESKDGAACIACYAANYERRGATPVPIFQVATNGSNMYYCAKCLKDLALAILPHQAGA